MNKLKIHIAVMSSPQAYMQHLENTEWLRMFKMFLAINEKADKTAEQVDFFKHTTDAEFAFIFDWLEKNGFTKTQLVLEVESFRRMDTKAFNYKDYLPDIFFQHEEIPCVGSQALRAGELSEEANKRSHLGDLLRLVPQLVRDDARTELLRTNAKLNADLTVSESQIGELQHKMHLQAEEIRQLKSTLSKYKSKHNELMIECKARLATRKEEVVALTAQLAALKAEAGGVVPGVRAEVAGCTPDAARNKIEQTPSFQLGGSTILSPKTGANPNSFIKACAHLSMQKLDHFDIRLEVDEGATDALVEAIETLSNNKKGVNMYSQPDAYNQGMRALMKSAYTDTEVLTFPCSKEIQVCIETDEVFAATQELRIRTHQLQSELGLATSAKEIAEREQRHLANQVSELLAQTDKLREEVQKANDRRFAVEKALGDLSANDRANVDSIASLNDALARAKAGQARLENELEEANVTIEAYAKRLKEKETGILETSSELGMLRVQMTTLTATTDGLRQEMAQMYEKNNVLKKQYDEVQAKVLQYEATSNLQEQQQIRITEQHEQRCTALNNHIKELRKELDLQQDSFATLREETIQLQKEHGKLTLEHNNTLTKLSLAETQLKQEALDRERQAEERKNLLNALSKEEEKTRRLENTYDTLKNQYTETYNYSLSVSEMNQKLTEEIQQLRRAEILARDEVTDMSKKLVKHQELLEEHKEQIAQRDTVITEQRTKLEEARQAIKKMEEDGAQIINAFEEFKKSDTVVAAQTVKKTLIEKELALSSLQQMYDKLEHEHKAEVSLLTMKNADLQANYDTIKAKSGELTTAMKKIVDEKAAALKAKTAMEDELAAKIDVIEAAQREVEDLNKTIAKLQATIAALQDDLANSRRENVDKISKIRELELNVMKLENKEAELSNLEAIVESYKATIQSLQEKLSRMEIDASLQQQAYFNLEQQLLAFSESREDQTNAITKLQERNKQITKTLTNIHKKYESLTASHEELLNQYKAIESERTSAITDKNAAEQVAREMEEALQQRDTEFKTLEDKFAKMEEVLKTREERLTEEMQSQSEEYLILKHQYQKAAEEEKQIWEQERTRMEQTQRERLSFFESELANLQRQLELERGRNESLTASLMLVQATQAARSSTTEEPKREVDHIPPGTPTNNSPTIRTMTACSSRTSVNVFQANTLPRGTSHKSRIGKYVEDGSTVVSAAHVTDTRSPVLAATIASKKTSLRSQTTQCNILSSYLQIDFNKLLDEHNNLSCAFGTLQTNYEENCNYVVQLEQRMSAATEELAEKTLEVEKLKAELDKVSSSFYVADSLTAELRLKVTTLQEEKDVLEIKLRDANITESNTLIALEKRFKEGEDDYAKALKDFNSLSTEYENLQRVLAEKERQYMEQIRERDSTIEEREADLHSIFDKIVLLHEAYRADYHLDPIATLSGGRNMSRSTLTVASKSKAFTLKYALNKDGVVGSIKADGVGKSVCAYIKASAFNPFHGQTEDDDNVIDISAKHGANVVLTKSQRRSSVGDGAGSKSLVTTRGDERSIVLDRISVIRVLDTMMKSFDIVVQNLKTINEQAILNIQSAQSHSADMTSQYSTLSQEYSALLEKHTADMQAYEALQERERVLSTIEEDRNILKKQLETLQDSYQIALNGIAEAHTKMTKAEHEILRLSHGNASLTNVLDEHKQHIATLNDRLAEATAQVQERESELLAKDSELTLLNKQLTDKTAKIIELETQILRIDGSENSMKQMVTEKNATLELLKENLEIVTAEKVELTAKIKDLMDKLNSVTASYTKSTRDVSRLEMAMMEQKTSLKTMEAELAQSSEEKEVLRVKNTKMQQEHADLSTKQISLQSEIERLQLYIETQKVDISRLAAEKDSLTNEYSAFKTMNAELQKDFESLRAELSTCKAKIVAHAETQREISALKEQLKDSEEDLKLTTDEMKLIAIGKDKIEGEMRQLNMQIDDYKVTTEALNKQISKLNNDYVTEQTRATRFESELAVANNTIKILTEKNEELAMTVSNQSEILAQRQNLSKDLIESMTASGRSLREQEEALEDIKAEYEKELHRLGSELSRASDAKKKLLEEKNELVQDIASLRAELSEVSRHNQEMNLSLEQLTSKNQLNMQAMMLDYDRQMQELQREKIQAESTIAIHVNEISRLQFENEQLMQRLAVLEARNAHIPAQHKPVVPAATITIATPHQAANFPPLASAMRLSSTEVIKSEANWSVLSKPVQPAQQAPLLYQPYPTSDTPVTLSTLQTKTDIEPEPVPIISDSVVDLITDASASASLPPYRPITQAHQPNKIQTLSKQQKVPDAQSPLNDIYKDFELPTDIQTLIDTYANEEVTPGGSNVTAPTNLQTSADIGQQYLDVTSSVLPAEYLSAAGDINIVDTVDLLTSDCNIDDLLDKYS